MNSGKSTTNIFVIDSLNINFAEICDYLKDGIFNFDTKQKFLGNIQYIEEIHNKKSATSDIIEHAKNILLLTSYIALMLQEKFPEEEEYSSAAKFSLESALTLGANIFENIGSKELADSLGVDTKDCFSVVDYIYYTKNEECLNLLSHEPLIIQEDLESPYSYSPSPEVQSEDSVSPIIGEGQESLEGWVDL